MKRGSGLALLLVLYPTVLLAATFAPPGLDLHDGGPWPRIWAVSLVYVVAWILSGFGWLMGPLGSMALFIAQAEGDALSEGDWGDGLFGGLLVLGFLALAWVRVAMTSLRELQEQEQQARELERQEREQQRYAAAGAALGEDRRAFEAGGTTLTLSGSEILQLRDAVDSALRDGATDDRTRGDIEKLERLREDLDREIRARADH